MIPGGRVLAVAVAALGGCAAPHDTVAALTLWIHQDEAGSAPAACGP